MCFQTNVQHLVYHFFFFNDTATTEIYTLSLHDALPISPSGHEQSEPHMAEMEPCTENEKTDRKSTRLNSSHTVISYAVFCLKKKKNTQGAIQGDNHRLSNVFSMSAQTRCRLTACEHSAV